jgi:UDP-2,3-diacylglucosamine pyrophosphatase LpxH
MLKPCGHMPEVKKSSGIVIVVADVHLSEKDDDKSKQDDKYFKNFIEYLSSNQLSNGGDLVLLGDTFDFWRSPESTTIMRSKSAIDALKSLKMRKNVKIHCIIGNHDYNLTKFDPFTFQFDTREEYLILTICGKEFFFIHGHQIEVMTWVKYISEKLGRLNSRHPLYSVLTALNELWTQYRPCDKYGMAFELVSLVGKSIYESNKIYKGTGQTYSNIYKITNEITNIINTSKNILIYKISSTRFFNLADLLKSTPDERDIRFEEFKNTIYNDECIHTKIKGCDTKIKNYDRIFFGHTHHQDSDERTGIVNVGSWNKDQTKGYCYCEISTNGVVSLTTWDPHRDVYCENNEWSNDDNDDEDDED